MEPDQGRSGTAVLYYLMEAQPMMPCQWRRFWTVFIRWFRDIASTQQVFAQLLCRRSRLYPVKQRECTSAIPDGSREKTALTLLSAAQIRRARINSNFVSRIRNFMLF
ncbi:hypothetical protein Cob_v007278 [Colletotrichum orbiculare MAFF 240422]|uniref:Uncharacterized protein n=1 Tax=Colletotrichum orbiculare (strain 104-T / ATCC 96160 / CBS 514.97 / LARS 414 / MAFF 240422) TaxID=1213857 RepID=A0A484FS39_COLOR|nr:hypothetical protein Cob_v007278 [Colletotrichum orbiculare MAFF 240422]